MEDKAERAFTQLYTMWAFTKRNKFEGPESYKCDLGQLES